MGAGKLGQALLDYSGFEIFGLKILAGFDLHPASDALVRCGVEAIWNFAPVHLKVPAHIPVQNENLAISLTEPRMRLRSREIE